MLGFDNALELMEMRQGKRERSAESLSYDLPGFFFGRTGGITISR
jgi:hypothetical protein